MAAREYFLGLAGTEAVHFNADGCYQEFLILTTAPEPSTYVLLASGLLLLVGVGRKRLLALDEEV